KTYVIVQAMGRKGTGRHDWLHAGQALLIDGGVDAVKLQALTCRLGVSTGSFYHHFSSFDGYLAALADFYGAEQAQLPIDEARARVGDDPAALLREATHIFGNRSMRQLNIAMRAWAQNDTRALIAIRRYDETLMAELDAVFLALGFDELAAKARTLVMMGLATVDLDRNLMHPGFRERWHYIRDELMLPQGTAAES
ncbi:MAG: TetR/AcrR family transcriptional regulator, partial [Pseudomonadota bacterium]